MGTPPLPPEMWMEIFRLATWPPPYITYGGKCHPFASSAGMLDASADLRVKYTLVLVSKQWQALATELLYEHIVIRCDSSRLLDVLESTERLDYPGYGRYVKSAQLDCFEPSCHQEWNETIAFTVMTAISGKCPNIQTIIKPWSTMDGSRARVLSLTSLTPEPPPATFTFTNITSLFWNHTSSIDVDIFRYILDRMPNLQYLTIGSKSISSALISSTLTLPSLTILRLSLISSFLYNEVRRWICPTLRHLILDQCANAVMLSHILDALGETLHSIELGRHVRFFLFDTLSPILSRCSHLNSLSFYIFFTCPLSDYSSLYGNSSLKRIRMHAHPNPMLSGSYFGQHFGMFLHMNALECITIYGDWTEILLNERFRDARKLLDEGRWRVEFEDGREVEFIDQQET